MKQFLFTFLLSFSVLNTHAQKQSVSVDTVYIQTLIDSCKTLKEQGNATNALIVGKEVLALMELSLHITDQKTKNLLKHDKAVLFRVIGNVYKDLFDLPNALEYYKQCLKTAKEIDDKANMGAALLNMGVVYENLHDYEKALNRLNESVEIFKGIGDKKGLALCFSNLGVVYKKLFQDSLALEFYRESINMYDDMTDKNGAAYQLNNMADIYKQQGNLKAALDDYEFSLKMFEETGDSSGKAYSLAGTGEIYQTGKNLKKAEEYFLRAMKIADLDLTKQLLHALKDIYHQQGKYKDAYEMYDRYILIKDSISTQQNAEEIRKREMQTDFDDKQAKLQAEKEKQAAVAAVEHKRQQLIIWSVAGGLLLVAVFSVFIFNRWRVTQKQKKIIEVQKVEVEKSKKIIEEKNKDITDSINYARRIQRAMLPHRRDIWTAFPQSFVLFKPKDIVSGDFYFFHQAHLNPPEGEIPEKAALIPSSGGGGAFIAACDCTGHGVPGAFMSMVGSEKLYDAVSESSDTSEILSLLNKGIKTSLKQSEEEEGSTRDGMDIALCSVDTENRVVKYAGANRPIWIIRKGQTEVEEIKATKKAIGGFTEDSQRFETHEIKLQEGDTFYLSTDGYADTFGKEGKKIMTKRFKDILISIQEKPMKEQEKHLNEFVENWKAGTEQVDDILVIGVRL